MASDAGAMPDEQKVVCVGIALQQDGYREEILNELARLVQAVGATPVDRVLVKVQRYNPRTLIGAGRLADLAGIVQETEAEVVVFDEELTAAQVRNLEDALNARVLDRTELILEIFAQRATSREGKLQVELARLNYLLPRLPGKGKQLSRLGGGIGTRGPGETKLEVDRRTIRRRIHAIKNKLERVRKSRRTRRLARKRLPYPSVSLVGYTNSGKSTLLNALSGADARVADQLFSTLDATTRLVRLPEGGAFFLSARGSVQSHAGRGEGSRPADPCSRCIQPGAGRSNGSGAKHARRDRSGREANHTGAQQIGHHRQQAARGKDSGKRRRRPHIGSATRGHRRVARKSPRQAVREV